MRVTSSEFQKIYDPSIGESEKWYINDHCFIQDKDGLWHMFGITHQEPAAPLDEKFLAHATSKNLLTEQWEKQPHILYAQSELGEVHVWAPHIIKHNHLYYMYYCAGDIDHSRYKIHLATSPDLWEWTRHPANPMLVDGFDARDPMIIPHGNEWILYYTANSEPTGGNHIVASVSSKDLIHWDRKQTVFHHPKKGTYGGPTESPFVITRNNKYYLLVCTNEPYNTSALYESSTPDHWDIENCVGEFPAHASEVIQTPDGETYISRAGWGENGLYLAELQWNK